MQSSLHSARKLSPSVRVAVETLLGRPLKDDEAVSIRAYPAHEAPAGEHREAALRELRAYFARIDEKLKDVPGDDLEEAIDEALRSVRPGYRPVRGGSRSIPPSLLDPIKKLRDQRERFCWNFSRQVIFWFCQAPYWMS